MDKFNKIKQLIFQTDGRLTDELSLEDSKLGLGYLPKRIMPDQKISSICGYCSTGCALDVHLKEGKPVNVTPNNGYPVNTGEACPKGWEALSVLTSIERATVPLLRNKNGQLEKVNWDTALNEFVSRFKKIQEKHGKESVAFLSTGQIPIEEMALLGALAKFGMGFIHGDGNTRQCMATAATAYKQSFGFDAPPFTYEDLEESDCLVFFGSNPCIAHPILWQRVEMNKHKPKIIVVDPRKTETAMRAHAHYAVKPKTDLTLLYCLANILIENDWIDSLYINRYTSGFEELKEFVKTFTIEEASNITGLSIAKILEFAYLIRDGKRVSFWWMVGLNQGHQAVRTVQAIINLALITGNIGRAGTGANSITGQCNAMGSRLFSNTTNLLGGHDFKEVDDRKRVADLLKIKVSQVPAQDSMAYDQIIEGIAQNKIKGLWVIATNPAHSWINKKDFHDYIAKLDFLVVQDMYWTTETAQKADLILPAAGWGEKEGVFINSERRLGLIQKSAKAPGEALADFYIFKLIAEYWGCASDFKEWNTPEEVFQILKRVTKGQPCDISGIRDYAHIEQSGGIQWPYVAGLENNTVHRRLFEDGAFYTKNKKAEILFEKIKDIPEPVSEQYPFVFLTGRGSSSQWHTQTRTGKSEVLRKMSSKTPYVEINSDDANRLNIVQGQMVYVVTRRARVRVKANVTPTVKKNELFMPMHYEETNLLTFPSFDQYSRQPSYKHCAANITVQPF